MPQSVLIVCTGNIWRSPMAEVLLQDLLPGLRSGSAGLIAPEGSPAHPLAIEVAARQMLDLSAHRARLLTPELAQNHDVILVMETAHRWAIVKQHPSFTGRVFLMTHWNGGDDIADPINRPRSAFEHTYRQINAALAEWKNQFRPGAQVVL